MSLFSHKLLLQFGGIQGMEWLILLVVVVVFLFGAKKLPELARSFGRATGEFQRGKEEIEREIKAMQQATVTPIQTEMAKLQSSISRPISTSAATPPPATVTPPTQQTPSPQPEERDIDKLIRIARELGIATEGKTEAELREEIAKAMMR